MDPNPLEQAIDWALQTMGEDGFSNVRGESVEVPRWVRGNESLLLLSLHPGSAPCLAWGGSVGTPTDGIEAEVLVVNSFEDLQEKADEARGRVVLFNALTDYGATVVFRVRGAIEAAKVGAVASLIRSVGPFSMQTPHTGMMSYEASVPKIPHAAITLEDASMMERMQARGETVRVRLKMGHKPWSQPCLGMSWQRFPVGSFPSKWCWSVDISILGMWGRAPWTMEEAAWRCGKPLA